MLKQTTRDAILELQKLYPEKRSALIPALHLAQDEAGFLPKEIQEEIAELFNLQITEVNSIVTFYDMFFDKPMGKRLLHVCKGLSCMLNGSDSLAEKLCSKLNVKPGGMSEDGEFTVLMSECLGACDRAPMAIVDHEVRGPLNENNLDEILEKKEIHHG